jgi:hypothetical protein
LEQKNEVAEEVFRTEEGDNEAGGRSSDQTKTTSKIPRNPPKMTPEMHKDLGVVPPLSQPCKKNT